MATEIMNSCHAQTLKHKPKTSYSPTFYINLKEDVAVWVNVSFREVKRLRNGKVPKRPGFGHATTQKEGAMPSKDMA